MTVFRTYLALLRRHWLIILAYTGLFLLLTLMMGGSGAEPDQVEQFQSNQMVAAVSLPTEGHREGETFTAWMENQGHRISRVSLSEEEAREAIFDHRFQAVFLFEADEPEPLALSDPASTNGYLALSVAGTYFRFLDATGQDEEKLVEQLLDREMEVVFLESGESKTGQGSRIAFFSSLAYILLLISTTLVPLINQSFSETAIRARSTLAPYPARSRAVEMMLGSGLVVFGTATVLLLVSLPVTGQTLRPAGLLLNLLVFTLAVLTLSHLLSSLIRKKTAITAVSTVLSLGMAFLSGAFIPQPVMGQVPLILARGFPLYYFIHANHQLGSLSGMTADLLIQLAFALSFFLVSLLIQRYAGRARGQLNP